MEEIEMIKETELLTKQYETKQTLSFVDWMKKEQPFEQGVCEQVDAFMAEAITAATRKCHASNMSIDIVFQELNKAMLKQPEIREKLDVIGLDDYTILDLYMTYIKYLC
jgi:hypothetical protein